MVVENPTILLRNGRRVLRRVNLEEWSTQRQGRWTAFQLTCGVCDPHGVDGDVMARTSWGSDESLINKPDYPDYPLPLTPSQSPPGPPYEPFAINGIHIIFLERVGANTAQREGIPTRLARQYESIWGDEFQHGLIVRFRCRRRHRLQIEAADLWDAMVKATKMDRHRIRIPSA